MNVLDILGNVHYQRTWLPCPDVVLKLHQDDFGPGLEDGGGEHTSFTLTFTMFSTNLLDLYFQVLVLIDAVPTDDSAGCCSGPAGSVGDMEG